VYRNAFACCSKFNLSLDKLYCVDLGYVSQAILDNIDSETRTTACLLFELICILNGGFMFSSPNWTSEDARVFINFLATS
jgi:hypothetical protein